MRRSIRCVPLLSTALALYDEALTLNGRAQVERNVRTFNEDGRDFIRRSVLAIWNEPFPAYVPALSSRERARRARAANAAKAAAKTAPSPSSSSAPSSSAPPADALAALSLDAPAPEPAPAKPLRRLPNHYIMNLPASALTFLDAFRGLYRPLFDLVGEQAARDAIEEAGGLPVVHCYCFTKEIEKAEQDICEVRPALSLSSSAPGTSRA